jgi:hypothetical protein
VNGGIIFPAAYKGPVVNIRAPKWPDTLFWIRAEYFEAAQYIADMVFYLTGRVPFHFRDARLRYPPLRLGTGEVLNTMEKCSAHVAKIAKGPALRNERVYYKERVQKFVLEMVKSPEVVQFLNNVRAKHCPLPHLVPEAANSDSSVTDDGDAEHGTPMEVDAVSEEAIHSLVPALHVDQFHIADMNLFRGLDLSSAFIPSFGMTLGMDLDEADPSILHSEGHSIGVGCGRKAKAYPIPSNLDVLLTTLDGGEPTLLYDLHIFYNAFIFLYILVHMRKLVCFFSTF